jgi:hypothetical protein
LIVLRVTVDGIDREFRSDKPRIVLGSSASADLRVEGRGWAGQEAVLRPIEAAVRLERPGRGPPVRFRVGDAVHLGRVRVALVGLLPRSPPTPAPAAGGAVFGGYDEPPVPGPGAEAPVAGAPAVLGAKPATAAVSPEDSFGDALYRGLKKSPFVLVSVALHGLLLLLAFLLTPAPGGPSHGGDGALQASILGDDRLPGDDDTQRAIEEQALPELEPDPLEDAIIPAPSPTPAETHPPVPPLEELFPDRDAPVDVGIASSVALARARTRPRLVAAPKEALGESFGEAGAEDATGRAAEIVRAQLGDGLGGKGRLLERLTARDILVVGGAFDDCGRVLDALRIPFGSVPAFQDFRAKDAPDFRKFKVVFWNCGEALPRSTRDLVARRVEEFVSAGGYLFTTDWAIANVLVPALPGYIETRGRQRPLPALVVGIRPVPGAEAHALLDGVFRPGVEGRWWLEQLSFDVVVKRPREVTVLIESPELEVVHGRSPAVAVTFAHGRGRVLHVMGHYFQEAGNIAGTVAAQRLALNFVLQRLEQDGR